MSTQKLSATTNLPEVFSETEFNLEEVKKKKPLPLYNVCFIGHVDAGKSTCVCRILFDTGRVPLHVISQFEKEAKAVNKESFKFAWLMDSTKEERLRGITIGLSHAEWSTEHRYFTIIDAPGHTDFIKNMIVGTSQADLAVLLVDGVKGILEAGSTEEHVFLARGSGIKSIVVAINKLNMIPLNAGRMETFKQRSEEIMQLLKKCGYTKENVKIIPINAWQGSNIATRMVPDQNGVLKDDFPGYDGETLIQALDTIPLDEPNNQLPLRFSIESVFNKIGGTKVVVAGKVVSGVLYPGQIINLKPANCQGVVKSIEMHHKKLSYATAGANVGISLKDIEPDACTKASIISDAKDRPAKSVELIEIDNALIRQHPTQLTVGSKVILHYQTGNVCCEVSRIYNIRNLVTGKLTEGDVNAVPANHLAGLTLIPERPVVIEPLTQHPRLCRVMFRDCNRTIGCGAVTKVKYSSKEANN